MLVPLAPLPLGAVTADLETVLGTFVVRLLLRALLALLVVELLPGAVAAAPLAVHKRAVGVPVFAPLLPAVLAPLPPVPVAFAL